MSGRAVAPPGWPAAVRPPGAPEWERTAGNWLLASNTHAGLSRRSEASRAEKNAAALQAVRQTLFETYIALEYFTQAQPKYASAFGRGVGAA